MEFDSRSARNLEGVHPDLIHLFRTFESPHPICIIDGERSLKKQREYYDSGKSKTMNSRHLRRVDANLGKPYAHAVDFAVFPDGLESDVSWDWSYYADVWAALADHAKRMQIPVTWGGNWASRDGGHIQLTWKDYPILTQMAAAAPPPLLGTPTTPLSPRKVPETSTTVAAAGGVSALAIGQQVMTWLDGVDTAWSEYAVLAVILVMAGWIVKERIARFDQEGI